VRTGVAYATAVGAWRLPCRVKMVVFFEQLVNGLTVGAVYSLVALGYTMVYGVMRLINFAHGDFFMLGSYLGYTMLVTVLAQSSLPLWVKLCLATLMAVGAISLLGVLVENGLPAIAQVQPADCSRIGSWRVDIPAERSDAHLGRTLSSLSAMVGP